MNYLSDRQAGGRLRKVALAILVTVVCIVLGYIAHAVMPHANISMLFLTGVLVVAARAGLGPALLASLLGFLAFNYFFITPQFTLAVDDDGDVATLVFFLVVAALTGNLAARMHAEVDRNRTMVSRLTNINAFMRRLTAAPDAQAVRKDLVMHLEKSLQVPCWVAAGPEGNYMASANATRIPPLPLREQLESWQGLGDRQFGGYCLFRPADSESSPGTIIIETPQLDESQLELVHTLCGLAIVALERAALVADLEQANALGQREQLRSALLSSVSHDLRTPLASIIGSTTSLLEYGKNMDVQDHLQLLETILHEAERLNRYIQNLLDMTRLGSGQITPQRDWTDISDIISAALERLHLQQDAGMVEVDIDPTLPLLYVQAALIEQALVNVLDNALRFSPAGADIRVEAYREGGHAIIDVCDQGPGIAPEDREKIFDMFFTVKARDARSGSGLGLAICKGMIQAHGGRIYALENPRGQGACIRMLLPLVKTGSPK